MCRDSGRGCINKLIPNLIYDVAASVATSVLASLQSAIKNVRDEGAYPRASVCRQQGSRGVAATLKSEKKESNQQILPEISSNSHLIV